MYAITGDAAYLDNYALTITVNHSDKHTLDIARAALCPEGTSESQGLINMASYEVVVFMKDNLMTKINLEESVSCRLFSLADTLTIMKHAMSLLRSVFIPYAVRLNKLTADEWLEVCQRIAGVFHRNTKVNIVTGNGITFTGITQLYYARTSLDKYAATKHICGIGKMDDIPIYYIKQGIFFHTTFPGLKEIEAVVAAVMGAPGSNQ